MTADRKHILAALIGIIMIPIKAAKILSWAVSGYLRNVSDQADAVCADPDWLVQSRVQACH